MFWAAEHVPFQAGFPDNLLFQDIPNVVHNFLTPAPPVDIRYFVNLEEASADGKTVAYDIDISLDNIDYKGQIRDVLTRIAPPLESKVAIIDQEVRVTDLICTPVADELIAPIPQIGEAAQTIRSARQKQQFFGNFAKDPQKFINEWLVSQSKDLETILGAERGVPSELIRRSEFYKMPWVRSPYPDPFWIPHWLQPA